MSNFPIHALSLLVIGLLCGGSVSKKVLLVPAQAGNHVVLLSAAAEALVRKGHEAHVLKHASIPVPSQFKNVGIKWIQFSKEKGERLAVMTPEIQKKIGMLSQLSATEYFSTCYNLIKSVCSEVLDNPQLTKHLLATKFDFVLVDSIKMPITECLFAVGPRLGVPMGVISIATPNSFPTTLQTRYLGHGLPMSISNEPSFVGRLVSFFLLTGAAYLPSTYDYFNGNHELMNKYLEPVKPEAKANLMGSVKLWFIDQDPMLYSPRHTAPNLFFVGGLSAGQPAPLPKDLQTFADGAKEGMIVISFGGSMTASFPQEDVDKLMKALNELKYKSVIRLATKPSFKLGNHIKVVDWLPQSDLLAHKNAVLFITHCGVSSVSESVYNGIPMIGLPSQDEQRFNAEKMKSKHYGVHLDRDTYTSDELKQTIQNILKNDKIKNAVKKASNIQKSRPMSPRDTVAYWVDHAMKYGTDHLIPTTHELYWFQTMMIDVMVVVLLIGFLKIFILIKCCKCCARKCCGRKASKDKKDKKDK